MSHLEDLTSPETAVRSVDAILAVPIGSTEQHGPHLPLSTDTLIATELCRRLATHRSDVVVAPALPYGASGEHAGFAGTLSIGTAVLEELLVELVRSASGTFVRVVIVSGHGGNREAALAAVRRLTSESHRVSLFLPQLAGDAHAGHCETSMVLALEPQQVRRDQLAVGDVRSMAEIWPVLRTSGVAAVTRTGVLGDPRDAAASEGHRLLDVLTRDLLRQVETWLAESAALV